MRKYGINDVHALEGGFEAWRGSGKPVAQGGS
jgi:rhodanese-related sulfurtransferase